MAQSESDSTSGPMSDSTSGPMSAPATAVNEREDELTGPGRLISSRWRPHSLRTTPSRQDRGLFGHPRGLPWMLNVEMWERFSYYGMRAILLYFITDTVARGKGSCWLGLLIEFFLNIHQLEDWPPNSGTIDMHGVL